jgi:hypothetical protein
MKADFDPGTFECGGQGRLRPLVLRRETKEMISARKVRETDRISEVSQVV